MLFSTHPADMMDRRVTGRRFSADDQDDVASIIFLGIVYITCGLYLTKNFSMHQCVIEPKVFAQSGNIPGSILKIDVPIK